MSDRSRREFLLHWLLVPIKLVLDQRLSLHSIARPKQHRLHPPCHPDWYRPFANEQGLGVICTVCVFQRLSVKGKGNRVSHKHPPDLVGIEFCWRLSAGNSICHILCGSCSVCTGDSRNQFPAALIQADFLVIFRKRSNNTGWCCLE